MSQGKFVATRDSMFQQKVQLSTRCKEDFVVTWKEFIETQSSVSAIQGNTTLSRERKSLSLQQIHAIGRNSIATKTNIFATEIEDNNRKNVST